MSGTMRTKKLWLWSAAVFAAAIIAACATDMSDKGGAPTRTASIQIDKDDIGGTVTGPNGPEAGVWVIAETRELPTRFARIVVTDDRGRYLIPDLPKANYDVWVRGYGLVDSQKVKAAPGKMLNLSAVVAPNAKAAAQYYPAAYWMSLLNVPDKSEFPGKGGANNFTANVKSQDHFLALMKTGDIFGSCMTCHQLGDKATREIPKELGSFPSTREAWLRRIQSGQAGRDLVEVVGFIGVQRT